MIITVVCCNTLNFVSGCDRLHCENAECLLKIRARMSVSFIRNVLISLIVIWQTLLLLGFLPTEHFVETSADHMCPVVRSQETPLTVLIRSGLSSILTLWSCIRTIPWLPPIGWRNSFKHKNDSRLRKSKQCNWRLERNSRASRRSLADRCMNSLFCNRAIEIRLSRGCGNQDSGGRMKKIPCFFKKKEAMLSMTLLLP